MIDFKTRLRKTLIWGAVTLFILYFFYDLLSLEFYNAMGTLIAVVGCIAITVCIVAFLSAYLAYLINLKKKAKRTKVLH
jgi:hypothetical protein